MGRSRAKVSLSLLHTQFHRLAPLLGWVVNSSFTSSLTRASSSLPPQIVLLQLPRQWVARAKCVSVSLVLTFCYTRYTQCTQTLHTVLYLQCTSSSMYPFVIYGGSISDSFHLLYWLILAPSTKFTDTRFVPVTHLPLVSYTPLLFSLFLSALLGLLNLFNHYYWPCKLERKVNGTSQSHETPRRERERDETNSLDAAFIFNVRRNFWSNTPYTLPHVQITDTNSRASEIRQTAKESALYVTSISKVQC